MNKDLLVVQDTNQSSIDSHIRKYLLSTKNAIEGILSMGEVVFEMYTKSKSGELSDKDLTYFCESVHLDPKGSSFRKYKAIGQNADRLRECMHKLPSTFSVIYEMATLSGDDFEKFVIRSTLSKQITLEEFKKIISKSTLLTRKKLINPPSIKTSGNVISKIIEKTNRFTIDIMRDLPESKFEEILQILVEYRNRGWIRFNDPEIISYIDDSALEMDQELSIAA